MFEGLIASILNRFFSGYIDEIDYKNLQIGLISGTVELNNLALKAEVLYQFNVPIEICGGSIGKLKVKVPWTSIYNKPVIVNIEDVLVLVRPMTTSQLQDPARVEKISRAAKRKQVQQLSKGISLGPVEKSDNFFGVLFDTVANNIQIIVRNIHVRYEDSISLPKASFSAGVVLKDVTASTTDELGNLAKLDAEAKFVYKSAAISGLTMYYNTFDSSSNPSLLSAVTGTDDSSILPALKSSIDGLSLNDVPFVAVLKRPIELNAKLRLNRFKDEQSLKEPHFTVDAHAASIDFIFNQNQALYAINALKHFAVISRNRSYVQYRPTVELSKNPIKWWQYAYTSVVEKRIRCFSWKHIKLYRDEYRKYKQLYKESLSSVDGTVQVKNSQEIASLEYDLNIATIVIARQQAKIEHKVELEQVGKEAPDITSVSPVDKLYELSSEERQQLYDILGITAGKSEAGQIQSSGTNFLSVKVNMDNIGVSLVEMEKNILQCNVSDIKLKGGVQPSDFSFSMELLTRTLEVSGYLDDSKQLPIVKSSVDSKDNQFFMVSVSRNPPNPEKIEFCVTCKIMPLEIVYEYYALSRAITAFLTSANMRMLFNAAQQNLAWFSNYSTAGLMYAIESHKRFKLSALVYSPILVIPDKGTRGNSEIVVYLGTVQVTSDLSKDVVMDRKNINTIAVNMYDKLSYNIAQTQVIIADKATNWIDYFLNNNAANAEHVLQTAGSSPPTEDESGQAKLSFKCRNLIVPINLSGQFLLSIEPKYQKLPQFVLESTLDKLRVTLSDSDILTLYKFMYSLPLPTVHMKSEGRKFINDSFYDPSFDTLINVLDTSKEDAARRPSIAIKQLLETEEESLVCEADVWKTAFDYLESPGRPLTANFTKFLLRFHLNEMRVEVKSQSKHDTSDKRFLQFTLNNLRCDVAATKLGLAGQFVINTIRFADDRIGIKEIDRNILINEQSNKLVDIKVRYIRPSCSYFASTFDSISILTILDLSAVRFFLRQEVLLSIVTFGVSIVHRIGDNVEPSQQEHVAELPSPSKSGTDSVTPNFKLGSLPVIQIRILVSTVNWLIISSNDQLLADIKIEGLSITAGADKEHRLYMETCLNDIDFCRSEANDFYVDVVNLLDDNVFNAKIQYINGRTSVNLSVGRLRIIFVSQFYFDLMDFASSLLEVDTVATKSMFNQARSTMYKQLGDATEVIRTSGQPDIVINAEVNAPTVLIPRNYISRHCLLLQMGDMRISSGEDAVEVDSSKIAVYSTVQLVLKSVQASRVYMTTTDEIEVRELIIYPITLTFDVMVLMRSKCTPAEENFTFLKISSGIELIKAELSLSSSQLFFAIVDDNILNFASASILTKSNIEDSDVPITGAPTHEGTNHLATAQEPSSQTPSLEVSVAIVLRGVDITIVEPQALDTNAAMSAGKISDNPPSSMQPVASLKIQISKIDFKSNKDGTLDGNVKIGPVSVDDIRPNSSLAVRSVIFPIVSNNHLNGMSSSNSDVNVFTADIRFTSDKDVLIDFDFGRLSVNLCLPFLLYLYKFIMDAVFYASAGTVFDMRVEGGSVIRIVDLSQTKMKFVEFGEDTEIKEIEVERQNQESRMRAIRLRGSLTLPRVALYAEPEKENSQILLLSAKSDANLTQWMREEILEIDMHVRDLSVELQRDNKPALQVLKPCTADLNMRQTREDLGDMIIQCHFSSIITNLTPAIYAVLIGVVGSLSESGVVSKETRSVSVIGDDAKLLEIKPLSHEKYDQLKASASTENLAECIEMVNIVMSVKTLMENAMGARKRKPLEHLNIRVDNVFVVYSEEIYNELIPLMVALVAVDGRLSDWTTSIRVDVNLEVECSYYNEALNVWEPLLDPLMIHENAYRPWRCRFSYVGFPALPLESTFEYVESALTRAFLMTPETNDQRTQNQNQFFDSASRLLVQSGVAPAAKSAKPEIATCLYLESLYPLTVNMSPASMRLVLRLAIVIASASAQTSFEGDSEIRPFLEITNKTGVEMNVALSNLVTIADKDLHGCTVSYSAKSDSQTQDTEIIPSSKTELLGDKQRLASVRTALISPLFALHPLTFTDTIKKGEGVAQIDEQLEKYRFKLEFRKLSSVKGLSFKKHGSVLRSVYKLDTSLKYQIVVEVNNHFSFQSICVSSPTDAYNNTDVAMTLYCEPTAGLPDIFSWPYEPSPFPNVYILRTLQSQEHYSIPLPIVYHCYILASPDDPRYSPIKIYDPVFFKEDQREEVGKHIQKDFNWSALKDLGKSLPGIRNANVDESSPGLTDIFISKFLPGKATGRSVGDQSLPVADRVTSDRGGLRSEQTKDFYFRVTTDKELQTRRPLRDLLQPDKSDKFGHLQRGRKMSQSSESYSETSSLMRLIVLAPVLFIENCLPFAVSIDDDMLDIGHTISWHGPQHITTISSQFRFHDLEYKGTINQADLFLNRVFAVIKFKPNQPSTRTIFRVASMEENYINVYLWSKQLNRSKPSVEHSLDKLVMFIPMWFYNFTGLDLEVKCDKSRQTSNLLNSNELQLLPIPYSQNRQNMQIRVKPSGTWSEKASLESIGVTSTMISKVHKRAYHIFLSIRVSNNGLTRMIYITSQYTIVNTSQTSLELRQTEQSLPVLIEPDACIPFWPFLTPPKSRFGIPQEALILFIREKNSNSPWIPFPVIDGLQLALCVGPNLTVGISGVESVTVTISPFSPGDSPVRLKNLCGSIDISFHQEHTNKEIALHPYESTLFAWTDPTLPLRLFWRVVFPESLISSEFEVLYNMDGHGVIDIDTLDHRCVHLYWFSYYDNLQRTFLLTDSANLFCSIVVPDLCSMEVFLNLSELRISFLTSNYEFALLACKGSDANWKLRNSDADRPFTKATTPQAEKWLDYTFNHNALISPVVNRNPYSLDYNKMEMNAPEKGKLDRTFRPAIKFLYRQSKVYLSASVHLNSVKVYNQLTDALFPVVFSPTPKQGGNLEPEIKCDIVMVARGDVYIIRSGHIAVREFSLSIDTGFLGSFYGWYTSWMIDTDNTVASTDASKLDTPKPSKSVDNFDVVSTTPSGAIMGVNDELRELMLKDISMNHADALRSTFTKSKADSYRFVIDSFEISPISVELSFSMNASSPDPANEERMVEELLGAVGHALAFTVGKAMSSFNNVPFRFKDVTVKHSIHNISSLIRLLQGFYIIEAVKQAYVLILGLNVLGNPYGLLKQFSDVIGKGLYDPVVNSIKDPSSTRDNISKSIDEISTGMSKTASTAANSVSLICDHLGRLLATASLDKHNRETRNRRINEANQGDMQDAMKCAGRNVLSGWVRGVRDLVTEPYQAASTHGGSALGYGLLRGVIGAATKPAGGIFDGATIFFRTLGRVIDSGDEPRADRLPRMINPELGLQPYTKYGCSGMNILNSIQVENEVAEGEYYWAHVMLDRKTCVLVTNGHIYLLRRSTHGILTKWKLKEDPLDITALVSCYCSGKNVIFTRKPTRLLSSGVNLIEGFEFESDCAWLASKINSAIMLQGNREDENEELTDRGRHSVTTINL